MTTACYQFDTAVGYTALQNYWRFESHTTGPFIISWWIQKWRLARLDIENFKITPQTNQRTHYNTTLACRQRSLKDETRFRCLAWPIYNQTALCSLLYILPIISLQQPLKKMTPDWGDSGKMARCRNMSARSYLGLLFTTLKICPWISVVLRFFKGTGSKRDGFSGLLAPFSFFWCFRCWPINRPFWICLAAGKPALVKREFASQNSVVISWQPACQMTN